MKKPILSYFNAPIAPQKDALGRCVVHASMVPEKNLTIEQVYHLITKDEKLKQLSQQVAQADDLRSAKASLLPYVTPCGVFSKRNCQSLVTPSGLLPIDVDHLDSRMEAEKLKQQIFDDPFLKPLLCFVSPSGLGVKAFIPCPTSNSKEPAKHLSEQIYWAMTYVELVYGSQGKHPDKGVDASGKDVVRACFLCHDAKALYRVCDE